MVALTFSHIGITVPDLEKAVEFYSKAFGLYVIMPPTEIQHDDSAIGQMCDDVFGEGWGSFRIAHLSHGRWHRDRTVRVPQHDRTRRSVPSNIGAAACSISACRTTDLEGRVKIIEELGGRQRMQQVRKYYPGEKPYRMVYMEDPFGNIFELYSHSYELTYSAGAYD
jgi:lactoylglutathione lyase family protein